MGLISDTAWAAGLERGKTVAKVEVIQAIQKIREEGGVFSNDAYSEGFEYALDEILSAIEVPL